MNRTQFNIGDKIRVVEPFHDGSGTEYLAMTGGVIEIDGRNICVDNGIKKCWLDDYMLKLIEPATDAEPEDISKTETTTKPKCKIGDKVSVYNGYDPYDTTIHDIKHEEGIGYSYLGDDGEWIEESKLHTQSEPKEDKTMEEKELNLGELLKDSIGEKFFHPTYGEITLEKIGDDYLNFSIGCGCSLSTPKTISTKTGYVIYYPSEESFRKYPLDGLKAWTEWSESRKPKRWTPQIGERIFWVNANLTVSQDVFNDYETQKKRRAVGNEFKTGKEAQQAAEEVRKCLESFHKRKEADQ